MNDGLKSENQKIDKNESKNFHLPQWFSFSNILKETQIAEAKKKSLKKEDTSSIFISQKLPKDIKDELEIVFEFFQNDKNLVDPNVILKELKIQKFNKENPKVYKLIDEMCYIFNRKEDPLISFPEFIEFLENKLLNLNDRNNLNEYYNELLEEYNIDKSDNNKKYLNCEDILKIFVEAGVDKINLTMVKKIMKEITENNTTKKDKQDDNNWDCKLTQEDFYYLMSKKPEQIENYFKFMNN